MVLALVLVPGTKGWAIEYALEVDNLEDQAFRYFVRDPSARGTGEPVVGGLAPALDTERIGAGAFLYDRDLGPASAGEAQLFGARPVRVVRPVVAGEGARRVVRWEGAPGERTIWAVKPTTSHWQELSRLALGVKNDTLRYYIPYAVSLSSPRSAAVAYPLPTVRTYRVATAPFEASLSRVLDLGTGIAAVVGVNRLAGDWVYLIVEQPPVPTAFTAVLGWSKRGPNDEVERGARPRGHHR